MVVESKYTYIEPMLCFFLIVCVYVYIYIYLCVHGNDAEKP